MLDLDDTGLPAGIKPKSSAYKFAKVLKTGLVGLCFGLYLFVQLLLGVVNVFVRSLCNSSQCSSQAL